jgi:hypothetical protein
MELPILFLVRLDYIIPMEEFDLQEHVEKLIATY